MPVWIDATLNTVLKAVLAVVGVEIAYLLYAYIWSYVLMYK